MQYRDIDRGSIADWSTLQYRIAQRSPDIAHKHTSQHARVARRYRPNTRTMQTGDYYLGPSFEWPLYTASRWQGTTAASPVKPPTTTSRWRQLLGLPGQHRNAVPTPASRVASSQQRCADRKNLMRVSPRTLTKDPCQHSADPSNMHSPVCSEATSACYPYSVLTVQWCGRGMGVYNVWAILREFLGHNFVSGLRALKLKNLKTFSKQQGFYQPW